MGASRGQLASNDDGPGAFTRPREVSRDLSKAMTRNVHIMLCPHEELERLYGSMMRAKHPHKWKGAYYGADGERHCVRRHPHSTRVLVLTCHGQQHYLLSTATAKRMLERGYKHDGPIPEVTLDALLSQQDATHTGNHTPSRTKIAVPTQPGQPVRA